MMLDDILESISDDHDRLLSELLLTQKRMEHLDGCIRTAYNLAIKYGIDTRKAVLSALLHDFFREKEMDEILNLAKLNNVEVSDFERKYYKVLHGKVAAAYFYNEGHINDEAVLDAVRYHTLANKNSGPLAKLIYIVDAIEPFRVYEGVAEIRDYVDKHGLDEAYAHVLARQIRDMVNKSKILPLETVEAYNQIMEENR